MVVRVGVGSENGDVRMGNGRGMWGLAGRTRLAGRIRVIQISSMLEMELDLEGTTLKFGRSLCWVLSSFTYIILFDSLTSTMMYEG